MAVRNFWAEAQVDGRKTDISFGPSTKDGGFKLYLHMRKENSIIKAGYIEGRADKNGLLTLTFEFPEGMYADVFQCNLDNKKITIQTTR